MDVMDASPTLRMASESPASSPSIGADLTTSMLAEGSGTLPQEGTRDLCPASIDFLAGMKFVADLDTAQRDHWAPLIWQHGGELSDSVSAETTHLITTMARVLSQSLAVQEANRNEHTLILSEDFLADCLQQKQVCPASSYIIAGSQIPAPTTLDTDEVSPSSSPPDAAQSSIDDGDECERQEHEKDIQKEEQVEAVRTDDVRLDGTNGDQEMVEFGSNSEDILQGTKEFGSEGGDEDDDDDDFDLSWDQEVVIEDEEGHKGSSRGSPDFVTNFFEDEDDHEDSMGESVGLPGLKMWKYREFGAPYFPHTYEIERMDILLQKTADGQPQQFFAIEQHLGDYFGKQCHRIFFHIGSVDNPSGDEEKWCLYFDERPDVNMRYQQLVEDKLNNKKAQYEPCFLPPRNLLVGSDTARELLELGWVFLRRMQEYMEQPTLDEGLDMVDQTREAFIKCRPASPLCLVLQSPEMVSLVLSNSFLSLNNNTATNNSNTTKDTTEATDEDATKPQHVAEENHVVAQEVQEVDVSLLDDEAITLAAAAEVRKELELPWREVCFLLIESGIHFNGFYKERKVLPIFEELMKNSDVYLHQLLEPFYELYEVPVETKKKLKEEGEKEEADGEKEKEGGGQEGDGEKKIEQRQTRLVKTTVGEIVPFGKERLCSIKFVSVLAKAQTESGIEEFLMKEVALPSTRSYTTPSLSLLRCAMESFFAFQWNNLLHYHVVEIVGEILGRSCTELGGDGFYGNIVDKQGTRLERYLLDECRLLDSILQAHREEEANQAELPTKNDSNDNIRNGEVNEGDEQQQPQQPQQHKKTKKPPRRGNMGHITAISNSVVERGEGLLLEFFACGDDKPNDGVHRHWPTLLEEWRQFVETTLKDINDRQNASFFKPPAFYAQTFWRF